MVLLINLKDVVTGWLWKASMAYGAVKFILAAQPSHVEALKGAAVVSCEEALFFL